MKHEIPGEAVKNISHQLISHPEVVNEIKP